MRRYTTLWNVNVFSALTLLVGRQEGMRPVKSMRGWWRWVLVSPDGVAPSWMVGVSTSVNLPLHHKVHKFPSGTGSPRVVLGKEPYGCGGGGRWFWRWWFGDGKAIWSVKSQCHLCPKILLWNTWRKKTKGQMFFICFTELSCSKLNFDINT